jgi:hypothetical protein
MRRDTPEDKPRFAEFAAVDRRPGARDGGSRHNGGLESGDDCGGRLFDEDVKGIASEEDSAQAAHSMFLQMLA